MTDPAPLQQQQPATPRRSIVEIKRKESEFKVPHSESLTNLTSPSSSSVSYTISNSPFKSQQQQPQQFRPRGIVKIKNNTNLSKLSGSNSSLTDKNKQVPLKSMHIKAPVMRFRSETPPASHSRSQPQQQPQQRVQERPISAFKPQVAPQITVTPPPPSPRERIESVELVDTLTVEPESDDELQLPIEIVNQPEPTRVVLKKIEAAQNHMNCGNFNMVTVTDKELSGDEIKQVEQEIAEAERSTNYLSKSKVFNQSNYETDYIIGQPDCQRERNTFYRRRSSKIGEEQNERELNSIFKRIYNRHRFSLVGSEDTQQSKSRSKSPGIRRASNNTNLSNF